MLVIHKTLHLPQGHYDIHVFDFSLRGSAALPLSDGINGETGRKAVFRDWRRCALEVDDATYQKGPIAVGDSITFYVVSLLSHPIEEGALG